MTEEEKKAFLAGMAGVFQGANMQNAQVNMFVESGAKVVYKEVTAIRNAEHSVPSARFPASIGYEHGAEVLILLKERGFVPSSTDPSVFLYQMGCTDECPQQLGPIVWLKNKQLLREMLELWFRRLIADKALSKARIEEICPQVFVGEDGLQLSLAKPKPVPSLESDELKKFFATV